MDKHFLEWVNQVGKDNAIKTLYWQNRDLENIKEETEKELIELRALKKRLENEIGKRESHRRYNLPYQGLNLLKEILSGDKKRV